MNVNRLLIALALATTCVLNVFADDTENVLNATRVNDVLRFTVTPKTPPVVNYKIDEKHSGVLHDNDTFTAPGAVDLTYGDFNPFMVSVSSTQTTAPDPVQQAIDKFASELAGVAKGVVPAAEQPAAGSEGPLATATLTTTSDCVELALPLRAAVRAAALKAEISKIKAAKKTKSKALTTAESDAAATTANARAKDMFDAALQVCGTCAQLNDRIAKLRTKVRGDIIPPDMTDKTLKDWIAEATGRAGVEKAVNDVTKTIARAKEVQDEAAKAKDEAADILKSLIALAPTEAFLRAGLTDLGIAPGAMQIEGCTATANLAEVQSFTPAIDDATKKRAALIDSLNDLLAVLKAYAAMRWRGGDRDVVFDTVETDPAKIVTDKVTFKTLTYSFNKDKNIVEHTADPDVTRSFDIRRDRRLITERGIAGIYNDLRYPKYSIGDDGKVKKDFDTSNVNAAITLNFLCGSCIGSGVYPGFQFGISKAKDYPGILGGGVLRFGGSNRIAVASGAMITWYKDLNALHVGDAATDDKLKADLKLRRSPATWYFAVQYSF